MSTRIILPEAPAIAKYSCPDDPEPHVFLACSFGHWAIVLVRSGRGTIDHAGHRFAIEPGMLICAPPAYVEIDMSADSDVRVVSLEERSATVKDTWSSFSVPLVRRLDRAEVAAWTDRLVLAEHKIATGAFGDGDVRALKTAFMERFWLLARPSAQRVVHETVSNLERELDRISTLDGFAADLGYTRNHLNDVMHDLTGASLGAWLTGMRMARARIALAAGDTPIAALGASVGYDDPAYFSRVFRRYHGVSPQLWRIAHRPGDARHREIVEQKILALAVA